MRKFTLFILSWIIGYYCITHFAVAGIDLIEFSQNGNFGDLAKLLIQLVYTLVFTALLLTVWLADIAFSLHKVGNNLEEKSNTLGQGSKGTSTEIRES